MLDARHDDLDKLTASDTNTYTLGRIGKHNVVIALLPQGVYGTTSAAAVATNLLASFPNIRFGILVGVGGGAPCHQNDVRLGDVVVSSPQGTEGGVVQYDLGKETTQGFERAGSHNAVRTELLTAIGRLHSDHQLGESNILRYISRTIPAFRRPNSDDVLFETNYEHVESFGNEACAFCNKERRVHRAVRETNEPQIHYGTITSGNRVVQSAEVRDRLRQQYSALCFEMEAAGLMNSLRCVVVRGICDYCDSHKNKAWQNHAALCAAAWTKELLNIVKPNEIASMPKALKEGRY